MKRNSHFIILLFICLYYTSFANAQFGGLTKKILDGGTDMATEGGLKKILKQRKELAESSQKKPKRHLVARILERIQQSNKKASQGK